MLAVPHISAALPNRALADAGHFRRAARRPLRDFFGHILKTDGVIVDEIMIEPIVFDHQMQHAVEQGDVAARLDRQEQIAGARNRRDARVNHDDFRALFARLPHIIGRNRRALGDVGAANPHHFGFMNIGPRIGRAIHAERFFVARARAHHAQTSVVINVGSLEAHMGEFAHQISFLGRQTRAR